MMSDKVSKMIRQLGLLVDAISEVKGKHKLLYVESEDGMVSADVFFVNCSNVIRHKIAPSEICYFAHDLWKAWRENSNYSVWYSMSYFVDDGEINIGLRYPGGPDPDESPSVRREAAARAVLGDKQIDYSDPWF